MHQSNLQPGSKLSLDEMRTWARQEFELTPAELLEMAIEGQLARAISAEEFVAILQIRLKVENPVNPLD